MYTMVLFGVSLLVHPMPRCAYITDWLGLVSIVQEEILAYTGLWFVSLEFSFKGKKILCHLRFLRSSVANMATIFGIHQGPLKIPMV